ncbi:WhiB family transcriptional regulator [Streptomyces chilikensis]|uniref:WhiB family transcriptional regulator n=1 Tax=Streptomyces chilikensis TaxID=1194079 RepID=A0ABV3EJ61_9ACTN
MDVITRPYDPDEGAWMRLAACRGQPSEIWLDPQDHASVLEAKDTCARCEVADLCLLLALRGDEWGIWGGLTREERRDLLGKSRNTKPCTPTTEED